MSIAKEHLKSVWALKIESLQNDRLLRELKASAASLSSPDLSGERVQTSGGSGAGFERKIDSIYELEMRQLEIMRILRQELKQIQMLDDPMYAECLELRYIQNKSWKQVTKQMQKDGFYYARKYIEYQIHNRALEEYSVILQGISQDMGKCGNQ